MNLREQAESDLYDTLEDQESGFGLPVVLISPSGQKIDTSRNGNYELSGQILYDTLIVDPQSGLEMVVHKPVVTLRRSSLGSSIPAAGEGWGVMIPETPDRNATKVLHYIERAPEDGKSIGFVRLYLTRAVEP